MMVRGFRDLGVKQDSPSPSRIAHIEGQRISQASIDFLTFFVWDVDANPIAHLKAYYKLADLCERLGSKLFTCFPLRRTHIPCYIPQRPKLDKNLIWVKVVNISRKALNDQGDAMSLKFRGMIHTDGIGVSILKQNKETSKGGTKNTSKRLQTDYNEFQYIDTTSNQRTKETKSRKFRKFRQQNKPKSVSDLEKPLTTHSTSTIDPQKYSRNLEARRDASDLLSNYYQSDYLGSLPFRKIKLSSYINRKQSDARLAKTLKQKFGDDCVFVLGNWSVSNTKYHEPIRGVGMRRMLKKEGLQVYLLDEYKTSSFCPKCKNRRLEKFSHVKNPRPHMRGKYPVVECHVVFR
ncbi:uncharacterized protein BX663DRAFT_537537 [Cokeromyces recurvatus]|uniref:uncharacterized protein n=1 Tax=Cokeromyces recurvatus TaxID=90255 RepID=UPI00221EFB43|nr:uncharacterized protein BX663DRAFT_537537 [Cokeromyces recurvatus]KAI7900675.1 hypothetical protein BX663DRAFT_537537 [Cokeromyces recurvatus]